MDSDHQRIMLASDLDRAARQQPCGVAVGEQEFGSALDRHERKDDLPCRHAARRSETQLAVKPGPSAVRSARGGNRFARVRSRIKSTVGADMLPYSAITCRSCSSVP